MHRQSGSNSRYGCELPSFVLATAPIRLSAFKTDTQQFVPREFAAIPRIACQSDNLAHCWALGHRPKADSGNRGNASSCPQTPVLRLVCIMNDQSALGYDPRPTQRVWHGTPIPSVLKPLPATPELVEIAERMWWNGDPWTILRNRNAFLRHACDHATDEDVEYLWRAVERDDWESMLRTTRPGQMSMRSYKFWMWRTGLLNDRLSLPQEWHVPRHMKDLIHLRQRPISIRRKLAHRSNQSDAA